MKQDRLTENLKKWCLNTVAVVQAQTPLESTIRIQSISKISSRKKNSFPLAFFDQILWTKSLSEDYEKALTLGCNWEQCSPESGPFDWNFIGRETSK